VNEMRLPATLQALLAARIDRLPEPAKHVLQAAAVIGKRFAEAVLQLVVGADAAAVGAPPPTPAELTQALRTLQRADLIRPELPAGLGVYAFTHPLTQEVAYTSQLQPLRVRRHEAVARALEVVHADQLGEHAALLVHHWAAADNRYEAQLWRQRAALRVTTIQIRRDRTPPAERGGQP